MATRISIVLSACLTVLPACSSNGGGDGGGNPAAGGFQSFGGTGQGGDPAGGGGFVAGGGASGGGGISVGGTSPGAGGSSQGGGGPGAGGSLGAGGDAPGAGGSGPEPATFSGCDGATFYQSPDDESAPGPWPVGVKTLQVSSGGSPMPVEVWYPAVRGSEAGKAKEAYDVTKFLWSDASKIPPEQNRLAECDCYRDLPIDAAHGPYPPVIFIHGTGSFRVASASIMAHWASRGFIAVAADHWGLYLSDFIACPGKPAGPLQDLSRDVDAEIAAMTGKSSGFDFFGSSIDLSRIGISGHSQGGGAAATMGNKPNVQIVLPISQLGTAGITAGTSTKSALFVCGKSDSVVQFSSSQSGYTATTLAKKRLVGITAADHLDVTDLCVEKNNQGQYAIQVAQANAVCGPLLSFLAGLAKCGAMPDPRKGPDIVDYVTSAALEETLMCQDRSGAFSSLRTRFPEVSDFTEAP